MCCLSFISSLLNPEILRFAIPDLCAEAVFAPERFERGVYGWYQFLQPHFNGHQLLAGEFSAELPGILVLCFYACHFPAGITLLLIHTIYPHFTLSCLTVIF